MPGTLILLLRTLATPESRQCTTSVASLPQSTCTENHTRERGDELLPRDLASSRNATNRERRGRVGEAGCGPHPHTHLANLAEAVVFPVPCRPAMRITVGLPSSLFARGACWDPINCTSSSFMIFTNCCSGVTPAHEPSVPGTNSERLRGIREAGRALGLPEPQTPPTITFPCLSNLLLPGTDRVQK